MLRVLRLALQLVLFFLLLGVVVGIGSQDTGTVEKVVLALLAVGLALVAVRVRRIGARSG